MEYGLCRCGCGQRTTIARENYPQKGYVKGAPRRYVYGHFSPQDNGGIKKTDHGYMMLRLPDHPHANGSGYVPRSRIVAERALGKPVPRGAEVHHFNGIRDDDRPQNLVICEDHAYHSLLHQRQRAFRACGHADWRYCRLCKRWDAPANLVIRKKGGLSTHRECQRQYNREGERRRAHQRSAAARAAASTSLTV